MSNHMEWEVARDLINERIVEGEDLNTKRSKYRFVKEVNKQFNSKRYGYQRETGFMVSYGYSRNLQIPWSMLEKCFQSSKLASGYNTKVFKDIYPIQYEDHDCYAHIVGRIFEVAGVAVYDGKNYIIV